MFRKMTNVMMNLNPLTHIAASVAAAGAFMVTKTRLDTLYVASKHPVDYATGQLAFDGEVILGYYDAMRAMGTFGIYVQTQLFDFAFIASVMLVGLCLGTLVARLSGAGQWGRKVALMAAGLACAGGLLDASENIVSFVLMQFTTEIPMALALIYSSFAALKFAALTGAMFSLLIAIVLTAGSFAMRALKPTATA